MKLTRRGFIGGTSALAVTLGVGRATGAAAEELVLGNLAARGDKKAWSFGVMCDTQWTCPDDPAKANPNGVSVSIIRQLNAEFIRHGVQLVIQVGDLTEDGNNADVASRAEAGRDLGKAAIGFFPMRGNHETYAKPGNDYAIPIFRESFPQTRGRAHTFGAQHFSSPVSVSPDLDGMTYSFDFGQPGNDARFVIVDDWATPSKKVEAAGYPYGYSVGEQQSWISSRLDRAARGTRHAFVFSHQNLIGGNHQDSLFNGYTNANPEMQNAFFRSLETNDVQYYISGHDHMHRRSMIKSPDGNHSVEQLICASNSSKFYTPKPASDPKWYGQKVRETLISEELYTIGYYIFTVCGPDVTVDYYHDTHGKWQSDDFYPSGDPKSVPPVPGTHVTPALTFVRKETWGYSLSV